MEILLDRNTLDPSTAGKNKIVLFNRSFLNTNATDVQNEIQTYLFVVLPAFTQLRLHFLDKRNWYTRFEIVSGCVQI